MEGDFGHLNANDHWGFVQSGLHLSVDFPGITKGAGTMEKLISELDRELFANHRFDTELLEELVEIQKSSGVLQDKRPICPFLRPHFLPRSRYEAIRNAARVLSEAFERLTRAVIEYPEIASKLSLTEKEERWARIEPGYSAVSVNSRLDAFLCGEEFAFLEYNGENPAGIGDQTSFENLFRRVPEVQRFLARNEHTFPRPHIKLLETLDQVYREFGGKKAKPSIAIVDWTGVATGSEFDILKEYFESEGCPAKICDPTDLEYSGGMLRSDSFEIDIFYKRVLIHEFLERFDEGHPLYRAFADGAVCMVNSFRSKIPHKKSSFSILSDDKYHRLFDDEQREMIKLHIPWTRNVRDEIAEHAGAKIDLLEFVRRERHRFILKPNDDYGGKGIAVGWECSESEWDDALETALAAPYVVQERVGVDKVEMPLFKDGELRFETLLVDFDPFLFCGVVEGGLVRLSSKPLVNVTQGGGETALAILDQF